MDVNWSAWRPRLLYGAFFLAAFLVALRQTLPVEAVKERLIVEAARQGWQLSAGEAGPAGVIGVGLRDVTVKDKAGLAIPMDELDVTLPLGPLLLGRRRATVTARLHDGRVRGTFDLAAGPRAVDVAVDHLDLSQAVLLRKAAGVDLLGVVSGSGRILLPADEKGKPTGQVDLAVEALGTAAGQVTLPGLGGGLTLPKLSFGRLTASLKLDAGRAVFEKLVATGGDAEIVADGLAFTLQPRLEFAPLSGRATVKPTDAFLQRPEGRSFKPLLDAALGAQGKDGWVLQVSGSLGHPQVRPAAPGAGGGPLRPPVRPRLTGTPDE